MQRCLKVDFRRLGGKALDPFFPTGPSSRAWTEGTLDISSLSQSTLDAAHLP